MVGQTVCKTQSKVARPFVFYESRRPFVLAVFSYTVLQSFLKSDNCKKYSKVYGI